eukprot:1194755-Prymnesium_polylepis.1
MPYRGEHASKSPNRGTTYILAGLTRSWANRLGPLYLELEETVHAPVAACTGPPPPRPEPRARPCAGARLRRARRREASANRRGRLVPRAPEIDAPESRPGRAPRARK